MRSPSAWAPTARCACSTPTPRARSSTSSPGLRPQAIAVSLLHSYADPAHELLLGALLAELLPNTHVSLSCELVGTFREYERTATTVLDAALSPLLASYLAALSRDARALGVCEPQIMQSSGGLTDAAHAGAHAALTVLSGPAGGVGGALALARARRPATTSSASTWAAPPATSA